MKKIIISTEALKPALSKLGQAIAQKPVLPVTGSLFCRVTPDQLELIATNTELTILYRLECVAKEAFEFLVPYDVLNTIVAANKSCPLTISVTDKINIKGNIDEYNIRQAFKNEEFPKIPVLPQKNYVLMSDDMLKTLHIALITTAKPDVSAKLANVLFELKKNEITIASTDGSYAVFSRTFEYPHEFEEELLLTAKLIKAIEHSKDLKVHFHQKLIGFESGNITVIQTRSVDKFVNFRDVFPQEWPGNLEVNTYDLRDVLNRCSLVNDQLHTTNIKLTEGEMKFRSSDEMITVDVAMKCKYSGNIAEVNINSEKMMKLLQQVEYSEIDIALHDSKKALVLTSKESDGYKALLMPIAVN
jgi:DNA polymerase-3 subunit beta